MRTRRGDGGGWDGSSWSSRLTWTNSLCLHQITAARCVGWGIVVLGTDVCTILFSCWLFHFIKQSQLSADPGTILEELRSLPYRGDDGRSFKLKQVEAALCDADGLDDGVEVRRAVQARHMGPVLVAGTKGGEGWGLCWLQVQREEGGGAAKLWLLKAMPVGRAWNQRSC